MRLQEDDLSELVTAADRTAIAAQRSFIRGMRAHYTLLVAAAACGSFSLVIPGSEADILAIVGALCFGTSLLLRVYRHSRDSENEWLAARAVAESTKSDCWLFAVAGGPYGPQLDAWQARSLFRRRQQDEVRALGVALAGRGGDLTYVSETMADLREQPFEARREAYLTGRLADQLAWYDRKSRQHAVHGDRWFLAMLLAEAAGLAGAVVKAAGLIDLDLLGIFAALASAFGAWNQMRQHRRTAVAYRSTATHLMLTLAQGREEITEEDWPEFVAGAENILSEEFSGWQVIRSAEANRGGEESAI